MRTSSIIGLCTVFMFVSASAVSGAMFTGSLSSATGGIDGIGGWINPGPTTIEWEVTDTGAFWHYKYTLTVPTAESDVSHFIIEVSDNFELANIFNATGPFGAIELDDFTTANGNPDIPGTIHGLKFDATFGTPIVIEFDSTRVPVWGDFYAKGGGIPPDQAWNAGLTAGDTDPADPPDNGSVENHILVPDSLVPEPATVLLLAVGAIAIPVLRRRRALR